LNGETEEIILREKEQLSWIATAIEEARSLGADGEELNKLTQLSNALFSKIDLPGTKAQLKPVYSKRQFGKMRKLTKLTLVFKWGGEVCFSNPAHDMLCISTTSSSSRIPRVINLAILAKI